MNPGFKLSASLLTHPIIVTFKDGIEAYVMDFFIGFTHEPFSNKEPEEWGDNMDIFMNLNPPSSLWPNNVLYHVHSINYKKEKLPRYYCFAWFSSDVTKGTGSLTSEMVVQWFEKTIDLNTIPQLIEKHTKKINWMDEAEDSKIL